ncbi:uncharacterized protein LOC143885544 [Tasmannia lanceolata]|uniref:uncharacterized protein LOC143885544 n=1 Tax=Tasmannia lanceolata TaxID=3420 RepID=UPI0040649E2D
MVREMGPIERERRRDFGVSSAVVLGERETELGHLRFHHPSPFYQIFSAGLDLEVIFPKYHMVFCCNETSILLGATKRKRKLRRIRASDIILPYEEIEVGGVVQVCS